MMGESRMMVTTEAGGVNLGFNGEAFLGLANSLRGTMEETAKELNLELLLAEKIEEVGVSNW